MKKLLSIFIVTIILFSTSPVNVLADNPKNSLVQSKVRFQQINNDIMNTNREISLLNSKIDNLKKEIKNNNENIEKNNKLIEAQKKNMESLEKEVHETQEIANKRLRAMYINSYSESFFTLLMSSENFADLLDRIESVKRIILLDKKILNELEEKRKF